MRHRRAGGGEGDESFPTGRPPAMGVGAQFIAPDVDAPRAIARDINTPRIDAPDVDAPRADARDIDTPRIDAPDADASIDWVDHGAGAGLGVMNHAPTRGWGRAFDVDASIDWVDRGGCAELGVMNHAPTAGWGRAFDVWVDWGGGAGWA